MTFNFNYKKFFKYFIIFLLCYIFLHSFTNVKATTIENSKLVINDTSTYFDVFWNYYNTEEDPSTIEDFNPYYDDLTDDVKSRAVSRTNSIDFADFENNYYYAIFYTFNEFDTNKRLYVHFLYLPKQDNDPFYFNFNFVSNNNYLDSSTTQLYGRITPNVSVPTLKRFAVFQDADGSDYYYYSSGTDIINWQFRKNGSGSYYKKFTYDNNVFTIPLDSLLILSDPSVVNKSYVTGNIDTSLYFNDISSSFTFNYLTINSYDFDTHTYFSTDYSLGDVIFSSQPYIDSNIQDLGDNSYGINTNYITVGFFPFGMGSINCPYDRGLINDVCYIYDTDIENFNFDDTSNSNFVRYYLKNTSSVPLDPDKYYILTIRIYSQYNLSVNSLRVLSGTSNNPTTISKVTVKDYYTYKDYQIVFTPLVSSVLSADFIDVFFDNYSSLTNSLSNPFSFGAFSTIKYSEYDNLPTDLDIDNDYYKNNLDTISKNSGTDFFTTFSVNDRGLSSIILLPLNFVRAWPNATCNPITLPLPHMGDVQLPCMSIVFSTYLGSFWTLYKIIINGFILYRICINLLRIVKNIYNVENNEIEVIDL